MFQARSLTLRATGCIVALCFGFGQMIAFGQSASFQRFDTQSAFTAANTSPTVVSYDSLASGRLPTYEYTFATEGVKMKPNDPNYTETLYVNEWSSLLPGKEIAITGTEGMEFNFTTPVNAFGYDFLEQTASLPGYSMAFTDSTFTISIYSAGTKLTEYTFSPANDVASFFGVSSSQTFDRVVIQETVGSVDDELYGKLYIKRNSACPTGTTKTIVPSSPLCIVRANVKAPQDTDFTLTGYDHLSGNCTLAAGVPQAPQTPSSQITVTAGQQRTSWLQGSPWANQLDPLLTCPAGAVKKSCAFTSGSGPLGEILCACYPAGVTPPATVVEPTYICVANSCGEGQYWCSAENACKAAGSACSTVTCNNNNTCDAGESCNCADCTNGGADDKDKCGLTSAGAQMVCTNDKDTVTTTTTSVNGPTTYFGGMYGGPNYVNALTGALSCPTGYTSTQISGTGSLDYALYVCTRQASSSATPAPTLYAEFGGMWGAGGTLTSGTLAERGINAYTGSGSCPSGFTQYTVLGTPNLDYYMYYCMKPLGTTKPTRDFGGMWGAGSYIPGYNYNNPVTGAASCPAGYAIRTGWGTDNLDWLFRWCYKPDATATTTTTTSTGILDSAAAQSNFDTVNTKLAPYLNAPGNVNIAAGEFGTAATELQMTQDTRLDSATSFTKDEAWARVKTLLSIPNSASVLWSQTSTQYGNSGSIRFLYSYVIQQTSGVQKQILFATEYLTQGSGWRKVYLVGKDFPLPVASGGAQVCQNFTNPRLFGNPLALSHSPAQFCLEQGFRSTNTVIDTTGIIGMLTMWNSTDASDTNGTAWVPNQNGVKIDEIKCCGIPAASGTASAVPVGACCPAGSQWSSSQGKCAVPVPPVAPGCAEGQYFCSTENICKPAGATCSTVTCNNNNVCDTNESCNCSDCNQAIDHCGINGSGQQLICTKDTAPTCYADKFPYCLPACLDGKKLDPVTGTCASVAPAPGPFACTIRRRVGTEAATVSCNTGEVRVSGGCANQGAGGAYRWTNFPIVNGQVPPGYPAITGDGWACSTGSTGTYVEAFAVCCTNAGEGVTTRRQSAPGSIVAQVECNAGETRIGGGCENTVGRVAAYWNAPMKAGEDPLDTYGPTAVHDGWVCHTGSSDDTVIAYALCRTSVGDSPLKNITVKKGTAAGEATSCDAGQKLIGGGFANNYGGGAYAWVSVPLYQGDSVSNSFFTHLALQDEYFATSGSSGTSLTTYALCASSTASAPATSTTTEQWVAYTYPGYASSYIILSKLPIVPTTVAGKTFYIYNPERIITGMSEATFLANPVAAIKNATVLPIGNTRDVTRLIFNMAQLQSEPAATQAATIDSITSFVPHRYMCTENVVGATNCSNNSNMGWAPCYGTVAGGDIYVTKSNSGSGITYALGQKLGTFTIPDAASCQNFTYPIEGNGFVKNDTASVTKYCTQKSFTSGTVVSTDSNGAGTSTWNGTAWTFSGASQTYSKEVQCCGGTVSAPVCQSYPNAQTHGGYLHMAPPSITQFCKESGFDYASLKSWYMQSGSLRLWNGTSWYEDITGGAVQDMQCCKNPATTTTSSASACFTPPTGYTPSATPPALPATAKYQSKSLLADGTVNDGIYGYAGQVFPCDNCYYSGPKANQTNPITFKIPLNAGATGSGKYYAFDILNNNYWINMAYLNVELKIYFDNVVKKSLTSANLNFTTWGMRIIPDPQNPGYGWVGSRKPAPNNRLYIILDKDNANFENWEYLKLPNEVKYSYVGTVADYGHGSGGGWMNYYGFIADAGFDASKVATAALPACQTTATVNTSSNIQLGACCPPGSAWNSTENRCVPTTCGEGQFYCSAQKKCLAGGTTCDTAVCNNDGVCSGEESCQCGDCVDGPTQTDPAKKLDDKDKCSIIGGVQAMCSDDNLTDNKPGACCIAPKKWNSTANGGAGACVECNNTQAPSELQANLDQPYITCTGNGDSTKTHFRYKLTNLTNPAETPFVSDIKPLNTSVLHPTLPKADYRVECFYGTAANVDTSTSSTPDSCVKTMSVKDAAQGCSRIYGYKGSTLSNEMTSPDPFDASFRCGSRFPVTDVSSSSTNPYILRFGTQNPAFLQYDSIMSLLFNEITVGPVSTQTDSYNIPTGSTNVSCAVKVGNGYSTNNSCNIRACAGGECSIPQTFSVVNSSNALCTTNDDDDYSIGCNPDAPQTARDACVKWFQDTFTARTNANINSFTLPFVINNLTRNIQCTKYAAGTLPGGLNMYDDFVCTTKLPNGETVELFSGDRSLQTTAYTVRKDRDKPDISEVKYFTDDTRSTIIADLTQWQRKNVFAEVTCIDRPLDESAACACAPTVDPSTTDKTSWSAGIPDVTLGGDIMRYTRTISSSVSGQTVRVVDTANNQSTTRTVSLSVDTQAPVVTITDSGAATSKTVTINATDGLSKIWKTTIAPSASVNSSGIIYKKVPKADADTALFDDNCGLLSPLYASVSDNSAQATTQATITGVNLSNDIIVYCTQDNAGNVTKGIYPSDAVSCFSATNMPSVPNLSTYKTSLPTRLLAGQFGYSLSEDTTNAACFRGILSSNIATLVTNQYTPSGLTTLDWAQPAKLKNTNTSNTNGYYYFATTNYTVTLPATNPTGTGQKVVIVDGGNIQINSNIDYTGTDKSLIIVARKINSNGGNIYINPSVTHIDAILIADGALMNGTTNTTSNTTSTTTIKNWIDDALELSNRLTINGRLYSFNTRGGSMNTDLTPMTTSTAKYFDQTTLRTNGTPAQAAAQDLEGFRRIKPDGNNTCSTNITYRVFTTNTLPPLLQRPVGYSGGGCGY